MSKKLHSKVLIIGGGAAGYTAAIYASRANLKPRLILGPQPGGQLMITTDVENYPGFKDVIQGPWLMEQMRLQAENVGAELSYDVITEVNFQKRPFECISEQGIIYTANAVIIATGAKARWLGLSSEEAYRGFGVSACATCDGFFFKGKEVAIVGGGNTAAEEAIYLTNFVSKVYLIHRRDQLRADKVLQDRLFANDKINILWNQKVEEIYGTDHPKTVTGITLKNMLDSTLSDLKVDGLFVAIGHDPETRIFKEQVNVNQEGYIIVEKGNTKTSVPGIFAAGDVQDYVYRQAITAAGQGCMAALDAEKYLSSLVT